MRQETARKEREIMGYSLGLYEKALPAGMTWDEMYAAVKEGGFDRLEISIDETDARLSRLDLPWKEQEAIGSKAIDHDVLLRTMCFSGQRKYPMGSHDPAIRARSMELMNKAIHFCLASGVAIIQLAGYDVYYEEGDEDTRKWFAENLAIATEHAAEHGVILAFETMETPFMDTVEKSMKYVDAINSPYLGVYPDIGNLKNAAVLYGHDVVEDLKLGNGHTFAVHLKETQPGIYRDMDFGTGGHTEYERCIAASLAMGVRTFTAEFWHQKGADYKQVVANANKFIRAKFEAAQALL